MASATGFSRAATIFGGVAVLFGIATVISGGSNILTLWQAPGSALKIVPFVLFFNFAAGFAYVAAGIGMILKRRWARTLAIAIAAANVLVLAGLAIWILSDRPYEMRTVVAMSFRTVFWLAAAILSLPENKARRQNGR
ncbi:hypothetical protein EUU22_01845 [Ciceribacter ferrooxidans]|uniref:Uncharacterized protein n=1 Tax=Ciceribacter ferrooxidans TaxID=2509717 RepID=A0A4Q2TWF0_9HYPH|nr:hypothetical protein EUU22_01845 [Ciceribacter ferrooxidans]